MSSSRLRSSLRRDCVPMLISRKLLREIENRRYPADGVLVNEQAALDSGRDQITALLRRGEHELKLQISRKCESRRDSRFVHFAECLVEQHEATNWLSIQRPAAVKPIHRSEDRNIVRRLRLSSRLIARDLV